MADLLQEFYECENPACRLRFPGSAGHPRWNRCPACRSTTHLVATSPATTESHSQLTEQARKDMVVILDNIRSAWNVGSIFRTADGTGMRKLYLCGITPTPDNPKVAKTALGAETNLPWQKANNAVVLAGELKEQGYRLWVLEDLPVAQSLFQLEVELAGFPIALVVGNEISGIDPGLIEQCERVCSIPMLGSKHSYNVAVAFGIAAGYFLYRQILSQGSR